MKCFRCNKGIENRDDYFEIREIRNKKIIKKNYVHRVCWNAFLKSISDTTEAVGMIKGLKKWFMAQGVLPAEEYQI